ncbi:Golgin subfamily A member 4 [Sarcoptes scabiei]|uniref:Golgin subfamily A member 4 n=1 Tax=Sarcoptes scabiei TaxID=52283 RepID=A0A834RF29_SARSC|nr:Golgin subfamily A member 4 [Sarcoptes scabiei]
MKEKVINEYEKAKVNIQSQALNLVNNGSINSLGERLNDYKSSNDQSDLNQSSSSSSLRANTSLSPKNIKFSEPEFSLIDLDEDDSSNSANTAAIKTKQSDQKNDESFFKTKLANFVNNISNFVPQSDIESEYESESTQRNLDEITKEQLLDYCYRLKNRSKKYRERWAEVIKAYRETVKEKDKLKDILTDSQDKAIKRMNELKEQCNLEQEAKRHLEANLRVMIEEKEEQIKILQKQLEVMNIIDHQQQSNQTDPTMINTIVLSSDDVDGESNSKIELLESLLAKCNISLKSNKEKLDVALKENESLLMFKEESNRLKQEIERQKLHDELESRTIIIKELKDQLEKKNLELKQRNSELKMKNNEIKSIQDDLQSLEKNFALEKSKLIDEIASVKANEIRKLQEEHSITLESLRNDLQSKILHLENENKNLQAMIDSNDGKDHREILVKQNEELIKEIEMKDRELINARDEMKMERERHQTIEKQFEALRSDFEQFRCEQEKKILKETETFLENENKLKKTIAELEEEIQKKQSEVDEKAIDTDEIYSLKKLLAEKEKEIVKVNCDKDEIEVQLKQQKVSLLKSQNEITRLKSEHQTLEKGSEINENLIKKIRDENESLKMSIDLVRLENGKLNEEKNELMNVISEINSKSSCEKIKLLKILQNEYSDIQIDDEMALKDEDFLETIESIAKKIDENRLMRQKSGQKQIESNDGVEEQSKLIQQLEKDNELKQKLHRLEELESLVSLGNSQIEEMKSRENHFASETSKLKNEIKDFRKEIKSKNNQIQEQKQFFEQIQIKLEQKEAEILNLQSEIDAQNETLCKLVEENQKLAKKSESNNQLTDEIEGLRKQNSKFIEEIAKMKANEEEIIDGKQHLTERLRSFEVEQQELQSALQETQRAKKKLEQLNGEKDKQIESLKEAKEIVEKKWSQQQNESEDRIKMINNDSLKNQEKLSQLELRLKHQIINEQELKTEVKALEEKLKSSYQNEKDLREELLYDQNLIDGLREQLKKLKSELRESKNSIDAMKASHNSTIESLYKQLEIRESQLDESLMNASSEQNNTNQELIVSKKAISNLEAKITELQAKNQSLENQLKSLNLTNNDRLDSVIKKYENQIETLQSRLEEKKNEISEKMNQFDTVENRLLSENQAIIQRLQNEINEKKNTVDEVHEYYQQRLKAQNQELKQLNKQLTGTDHNNYQINALQNSILQYHEENLKLKEMLNIRQNVRKNGGDNNNDGDKNRIDKSDSDVENCAILGIHLPQPTEYEYLRNILFEFMVGREPVTLAKVIAAVMRFNTDQTEQIIRRQESIHLSSSSSVHK